jgi:hypothetical protein
MVLAPTDPEALISCLPSSEFAAVFDSFLTNPLTFLAKASVRSSKSNYFEFPVSVIRVCFGFRASNFNLSPLRFYFVTMWQSSQDLPAKGACITLLKNFGSFDA